MKDIQTFTLWNKKNLVDQGQYIVRIWLHHEYTQINFTIWVHLESAVKCKLVYLEYGFIWFNIGKLIFAEVRNLLICGQEGIAHNWMTFCL